MSSKREGIGDVIAGTESSTSPAKQWASLDLVVTPRGRG
jgi:hypothetical protein